MNKLKTGKEVLWNYLMVELSSYWPTPATEYQQNIILIITVDKNKKKINVMGSHISDAPKQTK